MVCLVNVPGFNRTIMPARDVVRQMFRTGFPPPAPIDFVQFHLQFIAGCWFSVGIQQHNFRFIIGVGFIPIVRRFRHFHTNKGVEGSIFCLSNVDAEITAFLKNTRGKPGFQHSRRILHGFKINWDFGLSVFVQFSFKYSLLHGRKTAGGVIKRIFRESFKLGFIFHKQHIDFCFH